jgi:hypothetical protein
VFKSNKLSTHRFPMGPGWAKVYIERGVPIPEDRRFCFYDELASEDPVYRVELEQAIRDYGVKWKK